MLERELVHAHWHIHWLYTGILKKVGVIEYPSNVRTKGHLASKLFNYFVFCSILSS